MRIEVTTDINTVFFINTSSMKKAKIEDTKYCLKFYIKIPQCYHKLMCFVSSL